MAPNHDRLASARVLLAIAESGDAKREAYKQAAEEIAAHIDETGDSQAAVARNLQVTPMTLSKLLRWRREDYPEGTTPFTMVEPSGSKPTDRAAISHARSVLRNAPIEQVVEIVSNLPAERLTEISRKVAESASAEVSEAITEGASEGAFPRRLAEVEARQQAAIDRARERGDTDIDRRLGDLAADHEAERLERSARYARSAEHALAGLVRTLKAGEHDDDLHGERIRERMRRLRLLLDMASALLETGEIDWDSAFEQVLVEAEGGES